MFLEKIHKFNLIKLSKRIYPAKNIQTEGSGCVATMGAIVQPNNAQKDLTMDDILNSKMINKAIELFQPESQIRVKPKV